ncbi:MAG TPA: alpha/beta fold hydrolase [Vitreimonas sp.]|nr:alpha/beta fold hydrolase [Vitreimonas sp.]
MKAWMAGALTALWCGAAAAQEVAWAPYELRLRSGATIAGEVGTLRVPAHRDRENGPTMAVRFVRLQATGERRGMPIVYLAGGPGGSAIEAARGERWTLFEALRREGDVILLEQRGVGLSDPPPRCSTPWSFPMDQASTETTINAGLETAIAVCAAEWRAVGVDLSAYNAAESAADIADLARALGGRVRLVGISYGTFLAFAVLRDHAEVVERVVLAGAEGPDHTIKLPTQADHVLARLSARIAADPVASRLTPDLRGSVATVLARLEQAPVTVGLGEGESIVISKYDVQAVTTFLMATSENAARLPALYAAMEQGNFTMMAQMTLFMRRFLANLPAMGLATDGASPTSPARQRRVGRLARRSMFENAVNAPSADFARALGVPRLPARMHARLETDVPAYFISGDLDSRTPPENADEVRRGFRASAHLVLEGAGHDNDLFLSSPIIIERIGEFLRGETMRDERVEVNVLRFE